MSDQAIKHVENSSNSDSNKQPLHSEAFKDPISKISEIINGMVNLSQSQNKLHDVQFYDSGKSPDNHKEQPQPGTLLHKSSDAQAYPQAKPQEAPGSFYGADGKIHKTLPDTAGTTFNIFAGGHLRNESHITGNNNFGGWHNKK